jgi:FkbM family methyltransferase
MKFIRQILKRVPLARTMWHAVRPRSHGERLDRRDQLLTARILRRVVAADTNCIDVGAHTGEVLAELLRLAPRGRHLAVEPIPVLAEQLRARFPQVEVVHAALADEPGEAEFQWVEKNPAFSGLIARPDLRPQDRPVAIRVPLARLDDLVPPDRRIGLVKVDVEGAELGVFRGAGRILGRDRPWLLFEHGLGVAAEYGTTSAAVFAELTGHGLAVWRSDQWLDGGPPLTEAEFVATVNTGEWWNWLAGPAS